jgi:hypothetical protein
MDGLAMPNALDRDKSIVELRALLASYEERLSRSPDGTPDNHVGGVHVPEPVLLINGLAVDLRASSSASRAEIEAPGILDCFPPEKPEPFVCVHKVASGVFRVHPRPGKMTVAIAGPFSGPAPGGLVATVQTSHSSAPPVRFHIATWLGEMDMGAIAAKFAATGDPSQEPRFLTVPSRHPGYIISTDGPRTGSESAWSLVMATIADPPEHTAFAWAEFSDIVLFFAGDGGFEARSLR